VGQERIVRLHGEMARSGSEPRAIGRTAGAREKLLTTHDSDDTLARR
jgi:hypothetical protein